MITIPDFHYLVIRSPEDLQKYRDFCEITKKPLISFWENDIDQELINLTLDNTTTGKELSDLAIHLIEKQYLNILDIVEIDYSITKQNVGSITKSYCIFEKVPWDYVIPFAERIYQITQKYQIQKHF